MPAVQPSPLPPPEPPLPVVSEPSPPPPQETSGMSATAQSALKKTVARLASLPLLLFVDSMRPLPHGVASIRKAFGNAIAGDERREMRHARLALGRAEASWGLDVQIRHPGGLLAATAVTAPPTSCARSIISV